MKVFLRGWIEVQERFHEEKGYLEGVFLGIWFTDAFFDDGLQDSYLDTEHIGFEIDFYADMETEHDFVNSMWINGVRIPGIFALATELYSFLETKNTWKEMFEGLNQHFAAEPPQEVKDLFVPLSTYLGE